MRVNKLALTLTGLATTIAISTGCAQTPTARPTTPGPAVQVPAPVEVRPAGGQAQVPVAQPPVDSNPCPQPQPPAPPVTPPCRFVAFTSTSFCRGTLFVYDDAIKDVYVLNAAVAGLIDVYPGWTPFLLQGLEPTFYGNGRILFEFAGHIFYYDMNTEERVELAFDGWPFGAHPRMSENGILVYIDCNGNVVMQPEGDSPYLAKPRVITKIAAEKEVQNHGLFYPGLPFYAPVADLDITADGRWIVCNINGKLYLYDVPNPHLYQLLPLGGPELADFPGNIAHVAISPDGRHIAFTVCQGIGSRLLVLDRQTGLIDAVPYPNLGLGGPFTAIENPRFLGGCLYFEICTGIGGERVWRYDLNTEALSAMVILNNALGSFGTDTLISNPNLGGPVPPILH